ncbi:MAG: radical SAM protein [Treponema sp.]|jgi:anaerobic ribonucleoside-triphosphate reductase activating protein|nr:radical SAM protein [Treponema sp.]
MKIHRLLPVSRANGPGPRFAVWVQGCSRSCPECFNPLTHDLHGGYELSVSEIISQIPIGEVNGITVSGGEPFEQPDDLAALLEETSQMGLNSLVYTGFTYEELKSQNVCKVEKCLSLIHILIDGAYKKEIPPKMPLTGSGNQRVLQLCHGTIAKIYTKNDLETDGFFDGELIIDQTGAVTATGTINSYFLQNL